MADNKLYKYEITGADSLFRHNDEDKVAGDVIELTIQQAREFPGQLTALDPEGEIAADKKVSLLDRQDYQLSRDHEKLTYLQNREKELNSELDLVESEMKTVEARIKEKAPKAPAKPANVKEEKSKG